MAAPLEWDQLTPRQKLNRKRIRIMRKGYKHTTRLVIYPLVYAKAARKPIVKDKVVFVETRMAELDPSVMLLYERLSKDNRYTIKKHFLRIDFCRYREEFKRALSFVKDVATANYVIISDACGVYSCVNKRKGQYAVQLWHGCGAFKKFGFSTSDLLFGTDRHTKEKFPSYANLDLVTVSSPEVIWAYEEAMGLENQNLVKALGISRTDAFFDEKYVEAAVNRVHEMVPESKGKKIILYAPTFRGTTRRAEGPDELDLKMLAEKLSNEYVLLIKHHPFVKEPPAIPEEAKGFAFDISKKSDIQDLICASDICISDYSSLIYEYSLFERPMIFFAYDLNDYCDWRGFYYDYDELTPGPIVKTTEEVVDYIEGLKKGFDTTEIRQFREKFMSSCDGHATDRVMELIEQHHYNG